MEDASRVAKAMLVSSEFAEIGGRLGDSFVIELEHWGQRNETAFVMHK